MNSQGTPPGANGTGPGRPPIAFSADGPAGGSSEIAKPAADPDPKSSDTPPPPQESQGFSSNPLIGGAVIPTPGSALRRQADVPTASTPRVAAVLEMQPRQVVRSVDAPNAASAAAVQTASAALTASAAEQRRPTDRVPLVAPIASRPMEAPAPAAMDKRITPRSPRAALQPEHVTVPTRRSKRVRNPLVIVGNAIFTLLVLVTIAGGIAFAVGKSRFEAPGPLDAEKVVNISPRLGTLEIADLLRKEGVIDEHPLVFLGGVIALKARTELKSGEYLFPRRASVRDVVETMVEGKVVQHLITVPEGLTSEQIVARLLDSDVLTGTIKEVPREGTLLPESYRVPRGTSRELVIQRLQQAQRRVLQETWERRSPDLPLKTPEQLVILASIVERETSKPEERTRVASVFTNRLKQKKRLESDPTIIYGLIGGKGALGHPITKSEKEQPTPYNTYMIDGLPPGPIGNPGRASIEAAANPARTKEMYFVADGAGGHVFSESYDQHLKNVARLRVIEHGQAADAAPSPDAADQTTASPPATVPAPRPRRAGKK